MSAIYPNGQAQIWGKYASKLTEYTTDLSLLSDRCARAWVLAFETNNVRVRARIITIPNGRAWVVHDHLAALTSRSVEPPSVRG